MSLIVDEIGYSTAIRAIRELVLDTNPVQCFSVSGQGFLFTKDSSTITIAGEVYDFSEIEKYYDLTKVLRAENAIISIYPDFVPAEHVVHTVDFNYPEIVPPDELTAREVIRENYFSIQTIESLMEEFFSYYCPYVGFPRTVQAIYNALNYFERRKIIYWVAYYLVDRKRMNYAAATEMMRLNNGGSGCSTGGDFRNLETSVTTRVGEVFSVTEKDGDGGKGLDGFTSFWGDKYSYFTKLQLWIRDRYEKQFKDFSLRDDALINQTFSIEKGYEGSTWFNTLDFSRDTMDILNPDIRQPQ